MRATTLRKMSLYLLCIFCLVLSACQKTQDSYHISGFYFDTYVNITLYEENEELAEKIRDYLAQEELIYSATNPESELYRLNHGMADMPLSEELEDTLARAEQYSELTHGAVNATIGSVSMLWDFHAATPSPPSDEAIAEALRYVTDGSDLLLDEGAILDLGFIAKGAISEHLRDMLWENGIESAIIDLGGNIVVLGSKADGSAYTVGIEKPFGEGALLKTVNVRNSCVVTSGIYERCFTYDGVFYHHILDPASGYPVQNDLSSATIICHDPVQADALSTACMVLGKDKAMELINGIADCELILCDQDGNIITAP